MQQILISCKKGKLNVCIKYLFMQAKEVNKFGCTMHKGKPRSA